MCQRQDYDGSILLLSDWAKQADRRVISVA
jgi:hypothetical protein